MLCDVRVSANPQGAVQQSRSQPGTCARFTRGGIVDAKKPRSKSHLPREHIFDNCGVRADYAGFMGKGSVCPWGRAHEKPGLGGDQPDDERPFGICHRHFPESSKGRPCLASGLFARSRCYLVEIYYTTANLIDPDVFDVVYADTTPDDSHFENLLKTTIEKAKARIRANQNVARNYLYEGMAYALEARLEGLRAKDLPTARAGKKMRALLLIALEHDPHLT